MDKESNSKRITILNAFLAWLILFNHCEGANQLTNNAASIAMGSFFAISGFLLYQNLSLDNYGQKIIRRIFSLLIPYIIWQIIYIIKAILFTTYSFDFGKNIKTFFLFGDVLPAPQLWYLFAIFVYAVFSPALLILFKSKFFRNVCGILLIMTVQFIRMHRATPIIAQSISIGYFANMLTYLPCYYYGALIGHIFKSKQRNDLSCLVFAIVPAVFLNGIYGNDFSVYLLPRMFSVFLVFLLPISNNLYMFVKKIYLDKVTFLLFAIHCSVISDFQRYTDSIASHLTTITSLQVAFSFTLILLITLFFSYVTYFLLRKMCPPILSILTGGRSI